jgi:NADP-reducing hydrogenase subunit HndB
LPRQADIGSAGLSLYSKVYKPGEEKVTYVKVNPSKAIRIVNEHIMKGKVVEGYNNRC